MTFRTRMVRSLSLAPLLIAALLISLLVASPVGARTSDERKLQEGKQQLDQIRADLDRAQALADAAGEELADADEILARVEGVVNEVATAVEGQRAVVAQAEARLRRSEAERQVLLDAFNRRATHMFKVGPTHTWELVLTGDGAPEAMARSAFLQVILEGDQIDLQALEASAISLAAERQRASEEQERLVVLREEQEQILAEAQELRESRALRLADARDQVQLLAEQQDDLEAEQARIEALIKQRQEEARRRQAAARQQARSSGGSTGPVSTAGYTWPLCARLTSQYGPRWGRMHRGVDLAAPAGTPVGSSKAGTVISAGWHGGYGRLVLVDHGDGVVTGYAHLSSMAVSSRSAVGRGDLIGRIGTSGNSTGPHLHLEFRVNGQAVNPRQYLTGSPC